MELEEDLNYVTPAVVQSEGAGAIDRTYSTCPNNWL
jgi:hypothetical protein